MPDLLACPAPPKREAGEVPNPKGSSRKPGGTAEPFARLCGFGDAAGFAPAPRRVVFVVRGRPGPTDRPALPPGSPESWGAITDNTVLHHAPYPFPVFPACR